MDYVDYYKVLGVDRKATQEEISKAYKQKARQFHPDLNKNAGAEKKFKEVNEAHEVLKDPQTRQRFDTLGANWKHGAPFEPPAGWGGGPGGPGGPNVRYEFHGPGGGVGGMGGFSDFFESIFSGRPQGGPRGQRPQGGMGGGIDLDELLGGRFGGGFGGNGAQQRPSRGQDVTADLAVALEDSYLGSKKTVELRGPAGQRRYDVTIPQGIRDGEKIRLRGEGRPLPGGGQAGDLYITIKIVAHPQFAAEGDDLVVRVLVEAWDAALGTKLEVPTVDGKVTMSLPAGLASGQRLRLKGKGMPRRAGGSGDLYAELQIVVPKELSKEQERLFKKLRKLGASTD